MNTAQRFSYPHQSIQSIGSLANALQVSEKVLRDTAAEANNLYIGPIMLKKRDGSPRPVYDTKPRLKFLLKKINHVFFNKIRYPDFLKGSLKNQTHVKNAAAHSGCKTLIQEDIRKYYDNITSEHVRAIWKDLFKFSDEVTEILTLLVTKNGFVQQGSPTSSYIANLVFFKHEPRLHQYLSELNISYTRYIDDIALSSKEVIPKENITIALNKVIGMIKGYGLTPHPEKRSITPNKKNKIQTVTGLNVSRKSMPSIPKSERANIRAHLHHLSKIDLDAVDIKKVIKDASSVSGRMALLKHLHPKEHQRLRAQFLEVLGRIASRVPVSYVTTSHAQTIVFEEDGSSPF